MAVVVVHVAEQWGATGGKGGKGQQPKLIITSQWDYAEEGERKGEDRNPHTRVVKEGCSQSRANAWADNAQIFFFFSPRNHRQNAANGTFVFGRQFFRMTKRNRKATSPTVDSAASKRGEEREREARRKGNLSKEWEGRR